MNAEAKPGEPADEVAVGETATIGRAAGLGVLASLANIAASVVRSKATALFIGPIGIGMASEIQQLATLGLVPLSVFSGPALTQAFAPKNQHVSPERVTASALAWTVVLGVAISAALVGIAPWVLPANWGVAVRPLIALGSIGLVMTSLTMVATQALVFRERLATITRLQLASALLSAALVATLTWSLGLTGQFVAIAATPALLLPWFIRGARQVWARPFQMADFRLELGLLRTAAIIGGSSLVAATAMQGALYAVRWRLELTGGPELNGQFQAAWAIGSLYLGMVLSGIGNFAFPRFAAATTTEQLQREVDETADFIGRFAPPVVILAVAFSGLGVQLLYTSRFETATEILRWQLAGDVARCLAWAYAGPLLYRGRIRAFLATEFLAATILAAATWLLVPLTGAVGAGQAYLVTYSAYVVITAIASHHSLGLRARARHLVAAAACTAFLVLLSLGRTSLLMQAIATLVAVVWLWKSGALAAITTRIRSRLRGLRK